MVTWSGRHDGTAQRMVGSLISDVLLRTCFDDADSVERALGRVHASWARTLSLAQAAPLAAWDSIFGGAEPLPHAPGPAYTAGGGGSVSIYGCTIIPT